MHEQPCIQNMRPPRQFPEAQVYEEPPRAQVAAVLALIATAVIACVATARSWGAGIMCVQESSGNEAVQLSKLMSRMLTISQ